MTGIFSSLGGAGEGLFPGNYDVVATNRSGATVSYGEVVAFDITSGQAETTSESPGGSGVSVFNNVVAPAAATIKYGPLAVCIEAGGIADNAKGKFRVWGICEAYTHDNDDDDISIGDPLVATTGKELDGSLAAAERIVGIALEASTATTRTLIDVWFNGAGGGFGMHYAS